MAYVNQDLKAKLAPSIKAILKKYNLKGSIAINNHSTLVVNIQSGAIDFIEICNDLCQKRAALRGDDFYPSNGHISVNEYHLNTQFSGKSKQCLQELIHAMKGDAWYDNSDIQRDYFDTAFYIDINIGKWDKPYLCIA